MPVMSIPTVTNMTNMTNMTNTAFRSTPNILLNDANYNNISSATSTTIYYTIATILSLTFVIGVFFNSMAIFIFIKNRELRTPTNSFVMTLCLCDLFMCLLGVTVPTVKAWQRSPIHSHALCVFDGFVVYFFGLSSMYLLAAISVDRYVVIVRPMGSLMVTHRIALLGIGLCFGLGLFWTLMPLLGWNRFVPEGIGVSCSIWWGSADPASTSYIFTILVFCLLLPLLVMALCYINIYWMLFPLLTISVVSQLFPLLTISVVVSQLFPLLTISVVSQLFPLLTISVVVSQLVPLLTISVCLSCSPS
ncbi:hypothetical protein ACOMHN_062129 [Nucella lapillus]